MTWKVRLMRMPLFKTIHFKFIGGRVFKTGLSVFLTSFICILFDLPAIFAVITAIVTTEPTAADSIKKGIIRFPAAAIGAALALSFTAWLGESAATYALAATLTIFICHKLRLDAGILVATLTAVAMIPGTTENYVDAFFTRLGTTSIGIVVSTLVNFFVMPPKYNPIIFRSLDALYKDASLVLDGTIKGLLNPDKELAKKTLESYNKLRRDLNKTFQLCDFQREEWKYHRHTTREMRLFQYAQKKLNILQQIVFHLGNLQYVHIPVDGFTHKEKRILFRTASSIAKVLKDSYHEIPDVHYRYIEELDDQFWHIKEDLVDHTPEKYHHHFAPQAILLYELLSLHDVLEDLEHLTRRRKKIIDNNKM